MSILFLGDILISHVIIFGDDHLICLHFNLLLCLMCLVNKNLQYNRTCMTLLQYRHPQLLICTFGCNQILFHYNRNKISPFDLKQSCFHRLPLKINLNIKFQLK
jgi:hypothetical protein